MDFETFKSSFYENLRIDYETVDDSKACLADKFIKIVQGMLRC